MIITLRRGLNQHQTSGEQRRRSRDCSVLPLAFSPSLVIYQSRLRNSRLQLSKPLSGCRGSTHKFHHGNIWKKGSRARCRDRPRVSTAAIKTNQNKSLTALASRTHMHGAAQISANLINLNCFSAPLIDRRRMTSLLSLFA